MRFDFTGKTILLTGASRGIGKALTTQLLDRGAQVLAVARDQAALEQLQAEAAGRVDILAADLADPEMPRAIANWVAEEHPDCAGLINNAAVMVHTRLTDPPQDRYGEIDRELRINLTAPSALCAAVLPVLAQQPRALIANVTSGLALSPLPNAAIYCASKAGLRSFTKTLRYQCEDAGLAVLVSEVLMSLVDTTLSQGDPKHKISPDRAAREMLQGLAAGQAEVAIEKVRLLRRLQRLSPALADRLIRTRAAPASPAG